MTKTFLDIPLGSGPYLITEVKPGRSLTLTKNQNYWGKDLNVNTLKMYLFLRERATYVGADTPSTFCKN